MMSSTLEARLLSKVRTIQDFPKYGIAYKDITPILSDPSLMLECINKVANEVERLHVTAVVAIEARGFIFGAQLSQALQLPFVPVRKAGKLPFDIISESYNLEYGSNSLEIHTDSLRLFERVVIVDDVLATGGTARAAARLVKRLNGDVACFAFLMNIDILDGRSSILREFHYATRVFSLLTV